jgi:hypothetical protein
MVQLSWSSTAYSRVMWCAYCQKPATMSIPSSPEHVCDQHALEFWTGLLAYAVDHAERVKQKRPGGIERLEREMRSCTGRACEDESERADLRARAIAAAGPAPRALKVVPIRLAS